MTKDKLLAFIYFRIELQITKIVKDLGIFNDW